MGSGYTEQIHPGRKISRDTETSRRAENNCEHKPKSGKNLRENSKEMSIKYYYPDINKRWKTEIKYRPDRVTGIWQGH